MMMLPSTEQFALADELSRAFPSLLPLSRLHAPDYDWSAELHSLIALGCLGLSAGQQGQGLGFVEEALIHARLGEYLLAPNVLASSIAMRIAMENGADALLEALLEGRTTVIMGQCHSGHTILYGEATHDLALIFEGSRLILTDIGQCGGISRVDDGYWGVPLSLCSHPGGGMDASIVTGLMAMLLISAHLTGISHQSMAMAVEHVKLRKQFDKPLGYFQAVKHHCADLAIAATSCRDALSFAAVQLGQQGEAAVLTCNATALKAINAARHNAALNIQLHGGIGFSDEFSAHLLVRRAHVWEELLGGREILQGRIAELIASGMTA